MAQYSVEITNLDKFMALLKNFPGTTEKNLQRAIDAGAAEVLKNATRVNVPWKTGNLVHSFGVVRGRLFASVAPDRLTPAKYAKWVHDGTGPHVIVPKNGKALFWKGAAHPVSRVNHPGSKGNPFIPRILEKATPQIQAHFANALENILKEISL
jgi:hypothetical protein